ncbi:4'-phosphopantetheinyl transferase superfamily protein [Belliella sp. DSM 107340]|uniref:4'-phosphopantetheinyl transferase superfamily protein n=2 Tax=Belliella calami TaxID=2923436 RepID=A0ABS9UUH0_9BACT|nr:4'-phosphopantetheinyl transferase superfamily protein [Belliella calami]
MPIAPAVMPHDHEIQVWIIPSFADIPFPRLWDIVLNCGYSQLVSFEESQAVQKFIRDRDKNRKLMTFLSRKITLGKLLEIDPADLIFESDSFGKPFLPHYSNVHFNISHSGSHIVLAIGKVPLGIDLEYLDEDFDFHDMLNSTFQSSEIKSILEAKSPAQKFFDFWTRKEAFVKAIGQGLSIPPIDLRVDEESNTFSIEKGMNGKNAWICNSSQIIPSYLCSLVYPRSAEMKINIYHWGDLKG